MILGQLSASAVLCVALAHFLWQGLLLVGIALLLGAALRRFSAQAQYAVQMTALCLLPVAFAATIVWYAAPSLDSAPTVVLVEPAPLPGEVSSEPILYVAEAGPAAAEAKAPASFADVIAGELNRYAPILAVLYLAAVVVLALRLIFGLRGAKRLLREAAPVDDEALLACLARQCKRLGIAAQPALAWSRDVVVPTVIGIARPTILLPLSAASGLNAAEIETILTHELVHIRRYDHLLLLVQRLVEAVFFFHPAVWYLSRRISDVREHCCDDRVIALGTERQVYVESLLRAAELSLGMQDLKQASSLAVALSAVDNPSRLRERVLRLVGQPTPVRTRLRWPGMLVLGVVLAAMIVAPLAMQSLAQTTAEEQPAEKSATPGESIKVPDGGSVELGGLKSKGSEADPARPDLSTAQLLVQSLNKDHSVAELINVHLARDENSCRRCHQDPHADAHAHLRLRLRAPDAAVADLTSGNATAFRGKFGEQFLVRVKGSAEGTIWGTDVYTDDSHVGSAAVHAGLVKPGEEAILLLTMVKSPPQHHGSERNGVRSHNYGTYSSSYMLSKPSDAAMVSVPDGGTVLVNGIKVVRATDAPVRVILADRNARYSDVARAMIGIRMRTTEAPATALPFRGKFGRQFDLEIVGRTTGSIWGTDVYTDDSDIATAAVHAGAVKDGERAIVTVTIVESPYQHVATERNGAKSGSWGAYPSSFIVTKKNSLPAADVRARPAPENASAFADKLGRQFEIEVVGRTDGYVWGTDVYTNDSNIATAAVHAGLVKEGEKGVVVLTMVESPPHHRGTTRNGVASRNFGTFGSSYILQRKSSEGDTGGGAASSFGSGAAFLFGASDGSPVPQAVTVLDYADPFAHPLHAIAAAPLRGKFGEQSVYEVIGRTEGSVWGSGVYTDDSDIATAAVHAGLIKPGEKGRVIVTIVKSPAEFKGSEKNGVTTHPFGSHPSAYILTLDDGSAEASERKE